MKSRMSFFSLMNNYEATMRQNQQSRANIQPEQPRLFGQHLPLPVGMEVDSQVIISPENSTQYPTLASCPVTPPSSPVPKASACTPVVQPEYMKDTGSPQRSNWLDLGTDVIIHSPTSTMNCPTELSISASSSDNETDHTTSDTDMDDVADINSAITVGRSFDFGRACDQFKFMSANEESKLQMFRPSAIGVTCVGSASSLIKLSRRRVSSAKRKEKIHKSQTPVVHQACAANTKLTTSKFFPFPALQSATHDSVSSLPDATAARINIGDSMRDSSVDAAAVASKFPRLELTLPVPDLMCAGSFGLSSLDTGCDIGKGICMDRDLNANIGLDGTLLGLKAAADDVESTDSILDGAYMEEGCSGLADIYEVLPMATDNAGAADYASNQSPGLEQQPTELSLEFECYANTGNSCSNPLPDQFVEVASFDTVLEMTAAGTKHCAAQASVRAARPAWRRGNLTADSLEVVLHLDTADNERYNLSHFTAKATGGSNASGFPYVPAISVLGNSREVLGTIMNEKLAGNLVRCMREIGLDNCYATAEVSEVSAQNSDSTGLYSVVVVPVKLILHIQGHCIHAVESLFDYYHLSQSA